jgi:DNA-binding transcriptional LysR family regulator
MNMHRVQVSGGPRLAAIETNLVIALHALLEEQSVALAAKRIGLSDSATSHALARLRDAMGDPLLARAGRRLVRTPRGQELLEPARRAVEALDAVFRRPEPFDPRRLERAFRIATTDHVQLVLLRELDASLSTRAPAANLYCMPMDRGSLAAIREGSVDLSIGVFDVPHADIGRTPLFVEQFASVVRRGHRLLRGKLTLERWASEAHVLVAPTGTPHGLVDELLERQGLRRRVARTLPNFVDALLLVSSTDYVVTLPRTVVRPFASLLGLRALKVPVAMSRFWISMVWHRRHDVDPAHAWLRGVLGEVARALPK